jgi:murein DD-endopeptidase MepM/ murein hydrolase activator NlpD
MLKKMLFSPFLRTSRSLLSLSFLLAFALAAARAQSPAVTLTPPVVLAGAPELIRVSADNASGIDGVWLDRKLEFFRGHDEKAWFALAGVDVDAPVGPSALKITIHDANGGTHALNRAIRILPSHYRTSSLTVAPQFVQPGPEALKQIAADQVLTEKAYASSAPMPLWKGNFRAPVDSPQSERFGTRRIFNGTLASNHKGLDFRAPPGTPVRASNSGVVVLAKPLYYAGNSVIIDHGMGFFTLYMHFSRITVHEGQHVTQGQRLGLSGATGRVTGPHLHWAVRWQGAYLDPAKLLQLDLIAAR